jgi:hypothetical protein
VQILHLGDRLVGVVGDQRRHLERHPSVDAVGALVNRLEQLRGAPQVGQRELEEQLLGLEATLPQLGDLLVVVVPAADRLVEDRRVRRQAGH